jgi:hypothetical protein
MLSEMVRQAENASALGRNVAGFFRSGSGLSRAGWRVLRGAGVLALAALAVFHVSLLEPFVAGSRPAPLVAARSFRAAALTAGLVALRRRGVSPVAGRRALVVWLLVVFALEREAAVAVADDASLDVGPDLRRPLGRRGCPRRPRPARRHLRGQPRAASGACLSLYNGAERRWLDRLGMATVGGRARSALPVRLTFAPLTTRVSRRIP